VTMAFCARQTTRRISPREVKHKSRIPAPRPAPWCPQTQHADDDFLISGKSTPTDGVDGPNGISVPQYGS
jgi:hypothetical protein